MPLLDINNLTIAFGGLIALRGFNLHLNQGELIALIGPNGAGKTTAFNIASGVYAPTSGSIMLDEVPVAGLSPVQLSQMGIARTFQNIRLFQSLSVIENVIVALNRSAEDGLLSTVVRGPKFHRSRRESADRAMSLLRTMKLDHLAGHRSSSLAYGDQRRLEIARALGTSPRILMLDEPAAGMNPKEKLELMDLIRFIRDTFKVGIWLIEHDMKLVMNISERIYVLDHGDTIAIGTPEEIKSNPKVIKAYLGEESQ